MLKTLKKELSTRMKSRAFTLVELIVSIGIFTFMTVLLVSRYGSFNDATLLNNLAYDVALTIRTAQTYGISVKKVDLGASASYIYPYGVDFDMSNPSQFIMWSDTKEINAGNQNQRSRGVYKDSVDTVISTYSMKRGATIVGICAADGLCDGHDANHSFKTSGQVDIVFTRPDPNAGICYAKSNGIGYGALDCGMKLAQIKISSSGGATKIVTIRSTGQIEIED